MGANAPLPAGTIVYPRLPSEERLESAKHYLKMMIFGVESRPKGFDVDGITWLVGNFLQFVTKFRGHGDVPTMHHLWTRRHKLRPVPHGRKRSQHLVSFVRQLQLMIDNPGEPNLKLIYDLYDEVRTTMYELVEEFRSAMEGMGHKDLGKFTRELERVTNYHKNNKWY